jgi:hypothetical protein
VTAQPIGYALPGPTYPAKTFRAIRQALPADQRQAFNEAVDTVDLSDLAAVAVLRDKWWARAVLAQDDDLQADREACLAGELELVEAWPLGAR